MLLTRMYNLPLQPVENHDRISEFVTGFTFTVSVIYSTSPGLDTR